MNYDNGVRGKLTDQLNIIMLKTLHMRHPIERFTDYIHTPPGLYPLNLLTELAFHLNDMLWAYKHINKHRVGCSARSRSLSGHEECVSAPTSFTFLLGCILQCGAAALVCTSPTPARGFQTGLRQFHKALRRNPCT